MAPQVHADGVSNRDYVHPGAIRYARDLIVPRDYAYAPSSLALHLREGRNTHIALHRVPSRKKGLMRPLVSLTGHLTDYTDTLCIWK